MPEPLLYLQSMLMVIFGAGASFDSIDVKPPGERDPGWHIDEEFRPPLAKDLFGFRRLFADQIALFPTLQPIVPILRRTGGKNVETVLRELQDEQQHYAQRSSQLMAVRYYLQQAIRECEQPWKFASRGVTNYKALLDQINRWRRPDESVYLVTFNYDTLLEDATPVVGLTINDIRDYVFGSPHWKVFKLHGSVDWARRIETRTPYIDKDPLKVAWNHIDRASELTFTNDFIRIDQWPCGLSKDEFGLIPAIAIPVEKKDQFECPPPHLAALQEQLCRIDTLLIVGWRATEDHFLDLLSKNLNAPLLVQVVAETENDAREIAVRLQKGPLSRFPTNVWKLAPAGFTDFVVNRRAEVSLFDR